MHARTALGGESRGSGLNLAAPIPPLSEPPNWARLPIVDCGEPLVPIAGLERIRVRAQYALLGIAGASEEITLRSGVRDRLVRAAASLPEGIELEVFDGYRPLVVQQALYDAYYAEIQAADPTLTDAAVRARLALFVATPNADPMCPPPHRTGGAVDVYLIDARTEARLPMGTEPDEATDASQTRWFEEHPSEPYTTNRRLLFHAMTAAGFTNYLNEWWHFDFGNQRWANCAGQIAACYGIPQAVDDFVL